MHRAVVMVRQTSGDERGIALVRLDLLPPGRYGHRCRSQNHAFQIVSREFMIQRIPEAASLISAYKQHIVPIMETHGLNVVDDFAVIRRDSLRVFRLLFLVRVAAERIIFLVDVHSDVNRAIILHVMTSICMR